jgi:hypothetical protein
MPRYYFDVREGEKFSADEEGEELPGLRAAREEAALSAVAIGSDILTASSPSISVEVRDESGQQVVKVSLSLRIEDLSSSEN